MVKKFLTYVYVTATISLMLFESIIFVILRSNPGTFHDGYTSLIVDKYRILQKTNDPKIIIVSGSSSAFGLNQYMLSEKTGYKVVNLGLHAGFGNGFCTELAKENIKEGDIVLLGYEYHWLEGFNLYDQSLIMTGIDDNVDLYKHIPLTHWHEFIGYIFKYASLKNSYEGSSGIYSRDSFDENAQMIVKRTYVMGSPFDARQYGTIDITGIDLSEEVVEYLMKLKKYIEDEGASVYFISPPILKQAVVCDYSEFARIKQQEESIIGIPYISNQIDYLFDDELMSNAIYHCSNEGEMVRTRLLIDDLRNAGIIE